MSKAKKVIFVIVEGPTDEDALSSVLKQIFSCILWRRMEMGGGKATHF